MNRIRILLSLLIVVLLSFIFLRWENGPEQNENRLKIIHKRDRWTDTNWVELYGHSGGNQYSGEERPVFSQSIIENRTNDYLAQDEFAKRSEEENQREKEWEDDQKLKEENYIAVIKEMEKILTNHLETFSDDFDKLMAESDVEFALQRIRACDRGRVELQYKNLIERNIDSTSVQAYDEYCSDRFSFYRSAEADIKSEAKELAKNDLSEEAWSERNSVTKLSYIILSSLIICLTISLMIRSKKAT